MSLPRPWRLRRGGAFRQVRREGRSWSNRWVVLFAWRPGDRGDQEPTQVGFTVGRRLGKAVRRNRVRRVLAEGYRRLAPRVPAGWWIVVVAREAAAEMDQATALRALEDVLRKARILRPPPAGGLHDAVESPSPVEQARAPAGAGARQGQRTRQEADARYRRHARPQQGVQPEASALAGDGAGNGRIEDRR